MNKLEFPAGFNVLELWDILDDLNCTAVINFFDNIASNDISTDINTIYPLLYKVYSPYNQEDDYSPSVTYKYFTLVDNVSFVKDESLPYVTSSSQWNDINKKGISLTLKSNSILYLLDKDGNIFTSMYKDSLTDTSLEEISFSGFKAYTLIENLNNVKITFTYEGNPMASNSFEGYFEGYIVVVDLDTKGINWNTYYCVKIVLVNSIRNQSYPTIEETFKYSTDSPSISYLTSMQWNIPNIIFLRFNTEGKLIGNYSTNTISICKFANDVSIYSEIKYVKEFQEDWLTVDTLNIIDLYGITLLVSTNTGDFRQNIITVYSPTDNNVSSLQAILRVLVTQEGGTNPKEEGDYYTIAFDSSSEEIIMLPETSILILINLEGTSVGTHLAAIPKSFFDVYITKYSTEGTIIPFNPEVLRASASVTWIDWDKTTTENNRVKLHINRFLANNTSNQRNTLIKVLDDSTLLLNINVTLKAKEALPLYSLYGKENITDEWQLLGDKDTYSLQTLSSNFSSDPNDQENNNTREYYYKLICTDSDVELNTDSINFNTYEDKHPTVECAVDTNIENSSDSETENSLVFMVTYTVSSKNSSIYPKVKFIRLNYTETQYIEVSIHQNGISMLDVDYEVGGLETDIWNDWESNGSYIEVTDTGEGENVDYTSLLYKGGASNIYNTIEAKDARLFLGNYKVPREYNNIRNQGISILERLKGNNSTLVNEGNSNKSISLDIPTILKNDSSDDMRILKKGEDYLLGVVFVYETGQVSDVYCLNEIGLDTYSLEHLLNINVVEELNSTVIKKRIFYIDLTKESLEDFNDAGIAAIIPVRAINTGFNTIAQGFSLPVMEINGRVQAGRSIYHYPYRFGFLNEDCLIPLLPNTTDSLSEHNNMVVINTPEMDCSESLVLPSFKCSIQYSSIDAQEAKTDLVGVHLQVDSKYVYSYHKSNSDIWHGFVDNGSSDISSLSDSNRYKDFKIYIWNKEIIGGEWPAAKIKGKVFVYSGETSLKNPSLNNYYDDVTCYTYRNYDYTELLKLNSSFYYGNVDYMFTTSAGYQVTADIGVLGSEEYVVATTGNSDFSYTIESGINGTGQCYSPVWMRYKSSPHLVVELGNSSFNIPNTITAKSIVELYNNNRIVKDKTTKIYAKWIKCGPMVSTSIKARRPLRFIAGDWFWGKYECLRTYPYTKEDPNSIVEVFSAYLASTVNLSCRADSNRGVAASYINPTNFNLFNSVYNQENNFFTYTYLDDNISYNRNFSNTIQWSLNKSYGSIIDDWCLIQDVNSLDLDGDKGELISIERYNDSLIAFQTSGISLILYNDNVLIASTQGVPIEIANSQSVLGKRYLLDRIGCQNRESIVNSPKYLYFIDSINKGIYTLGRDLSINDITYLKGMKSWGLNALTKDWWGYYDVYSLEVLFADLNNCIAYNDMLEYFPCFLSYLNIKHLISLNGRTYLFNKVNSENILWKKNTINENRIFGLKVPVLIEMIVNPEPTIDKTFNILEYRADGFTSYNDALIFSKDNKYDEEASFDSIRVSNEYQDTTEVPLKLSANKETYSTSANTQKKFRIWRVDIPRAKYYIYDTQKPMYRDSMDRIRNPWCKIKLTTTMGNYEKFIVHDFAVKYFK